MPFKKLLISTLFFCLTLVSCEKDSNDLVAEPLNQCQQIEVINSSDSIFLSLRGTTLKGHITGNIIQTSSVSGAQSSQPIEIQFQAEELNPAEGLWGCD